MRTESQMMELVREKLGRRRRRRRTVAASAGGGMAAALLAVVLLTGGTGGQGAVEDVKTGPGAVVTSSTIGPHAGPRGVGSTTTAPRPSESNAGGGASDTGSPSLVDDGADASDPGDGGGGGGDADGDPAGSDPDGPTPTTTVSGIDEGDDVVIPPDTTEPPFWRQWEQPLHARDGDLELNVTLRRWDPDRPDILEVQIHFDDPTGIMAHNHGRMGPGVVLTPEGGSPISWGDPEPPCGADDNYTVEPVHFDETVEISIGPGDELGFRVVTLPCMPEVDVIDFVTEVPTPTP